LGFLLVLRPFDGMSVLTHLSQNEPSPSPNLDPAPNYLKKDRREREKESLRKKGNKR